MENLIQEHWNKAPRELPGINCIVFPTGDVIMLNCWDLYNPNTEERKAFCTPLCDTNIAAIEKYQASEWVIVDAWTIVEDQGSKFYGGDGTMGHEGFIACTDLNDNLIWAMFFTNSNPIKKVEIKGNHLVALNEHENMRISIDLENLTDIEMVYLM